MGATVRDVQQAKVYTAETIFARTLDKGGAVQIAGTTVQLPPEARFGDVDSIQRYVDSVIARPTVAARFGSVRPVRVRARRGNAAAHYEPPGVIAIPVSRDSTPFRREVVVAHELAHHLTPAGAPHGPEFTDTLLWLIDELLGPQAAFVLRVLYLESEVAVG